MGEGGGVGTCVINDVDKIINCDYVDSPWSRKKVKQARRTEVCGQSGVDVYPSHYLR